MVFRRFLVWRVQSGLGSNHKTNSVLLRPSSLPPVAAARGTTMITRKIVAFMEYVGDENWSIACRGKGLVENFFVSLKSGEETDIAVEWSL